jgi:hypothetical protein
MPMLIALEEDLLVPPDPVPLLPLLQPASVASATAAASSAPVFLRVLRISFLLSYLFS